MWLKLERRVGSRVQAAIASIAETAGGLHQLATSKGDIMSFSIGTALADARDNRAQTDLLVEGQWIHGQITAVDGFGVVLERPDGSHSVVRVESIAAVEVNAPGATSGRTIPRQMSMAH